MKIDRLDHLVLTVRDVEDTIAFYVRVLGMEAVTFAGGRRALMFGEQKINLHPAHRPFDPCAATPTPGSADLCFATSLPMEEVTAHLERERILIDFGPVARTGAKGPMRSLYFRDPDGNLLEIACYE